jgi:hypothetical protein
LGRVRAEARQKSRRRLTISRPAPPGVNAALTITDYESVQSFCLDSEWLLSILFDASRFPTQRPPSGGLSLFVLILVMPR